MRWLGGTEQDAQTLEIKLEDHSGTQEPKQRHSSGNPGLIGL